MKNVCIAIAVLALCGYAAAECANACSGHGFCAINDQCNCFRNWQSSDCSERTCTFGLAFIDTPRGDLNGDRTVSHATAVPVPWQVNDVYEYALPNDASDGEAHFYRECSNKGLCNRKSGECECFDGYEGVSCKRTVCPNACSGHGTCESIKELGETSGWQPSVTYTHTDGNDKARFAAVLHEVDETGYNGGGEKGVTDSNGYALWDQDKTFGCKCDEGFSGPDCSLRECPTGDDPLTAGQANEVQTVTCTTAGEVGGVIVTDTFGERWRLESTCVDAATLIGATSQAAFDAVYDFPLKFGGATLGSVDSDTDGADGMDLVITFDGQSGDIDEVEVFGTGFSVTTTTAGTKEATTCSGRGLCDYGTGICKCFRGYTLADCSRQNALAY